MFCIYHRPRWMTKRCLRLTLLAQGTLNTKTPLLAAFGLAANCHPTHSLAPPLAWPSAYSKNARPPDISRKLSWWCSALSWSVRVSALRNRADWNGRLERSVGSRRLGGNGNVSENMGLGRSRQLGRVSVYKLLANEAWGKAFVPSTPRSWKINLIQIVYFLGLDPVELIILVLQSHIIINDSLTFTCLILYDNMALLPCCPLETLALPA